jgi:hypothetical protein
MAANGQALPTGRQALVLGVMGFFLLASAGTAKAASDSVACLQEIEKVCSGQENSLETCLSERGDRLSADCRQQLKEAMALVQDPSGPAACIPDVQRLCPDRTPQAIAACISDQQPHFSKACQDYLQASRQKPAE